ncbi:MAG: alpha/beta fold hydrolase [Acinetobacter sp.]|nr:alpha/beta fold hydrolase [Acinetobacter sp.]
MSNLVFLPGALGNTQFWNPLIAQLPEHYTKQVIAYPSFHGMAAHPDINSFDDLTNYVVAQIQQPSILIAQSMGGIFAIATTLKKTDLVKGLVLIATSGGINLDLFLVQDWRQAYQQEYLQYPDWFVTAKVDYEAQLAHIQQQVLLLWGDQDLISPVAVGQHLHHLFQKSQLHIIQGGEHDFAEQYVNEVTIYINDFIRKF